MATPSASSSSSSLLPTNTEESSGRSAILFGTIMVTLTLVGWSSVPLFLRHFADSIDMWTSNGWRYGFSALVWLPLLVVVSARRMLPAGLWRAALVPGLLNALGQVCFTWAHYRIDPGLLTFGLRSQLLFVAVGAFILFPRERAIIRTRGYLLGILLLAVGTIGVMAFAVPADGEARALATGSVRGSLAAYLQGVALAMASGMLFAGYALSVRKFMHGMNPVTAFAAICQYTALVMVGLMVLLGERLGATVLDLPVEQIAWLLISALIGIAIGHVFYYISIARLGVAVSAGVLQLQPFLVAIGSWVYFSEVLSSLQWIGGIVAISGALCMVSVQWRMSRRLAVPRTP